MSIKYYDGMILTDNTVSGINQLVNDCKNELTPVINQEFRKYVALMASDLYIRMYMGDRSMPDCIDDAQLARDYFRNPMNPQWDTKPLSGKNILHIAKQIVMAACMDNMSVSYLKDKFLMDYFDLEITFIPVWDKVLCVPHSSNQRLLDCLANQPLLLDYHYSASESRPEDISDEAWKEREKIWKKATELNPSQEKYNGGFTVSILNANRDLDTELNNIQNDILPYLPYDVDSLIKSAAKYAMFEKYYTEKHKNDEDEDVIDYNDVQVWKIVQKHPEELNTMIENFAHHINLTDFFESASHNK